ncbi:hypothetical protein K7472_10515 [Streptomyces sp. PTM05]|uniref:Secreted protein n=1 Tax=Streptantibioticus parmotrematis TaxID=2873249 RepID=A0ABS7QQ03_9ACTN|nr:hypothetical protein [Streptantibioticus parmotrematis]MBY8885277.1 hypothetical protein [Streptantibioticus parmotrematis]
MRRIIRMLVLFTAASAPVFGLAVAPGEASAAARPSVSAPSGCAYTATADSSGVYGVTATCDAAAGQRWYVDVRCQYDYRGQEIDSWVPGTTVSGSGTSTGSCVLIGAPVLAHQIVVTS